MPPHKNPLVTMIQDLSAAIDPLPTDVSAFLARFGGIRAIVFDVYGTLFISGSGDLGVHGETDNTRALHDALASAGFAGDLQTAAAQGVNRLGETIKKHHAARRNAGVEYPEVEIRSVWREVIGTLCSDGLLHCADGVQSSGVLLKSDMPDEMQALRSAADRETGPVDLHRSIERLAVAFECAVNPVWPMPDLLPMLAEVQSSDVALGIVSNAQFYTPLMFEAFLDRTVEEVGFDTDLSVWSYRELMGKPSVELYETLCERLKQKGIAPHETLYVGNDMLKDVWAASQAGLKTVLFAGDKRSLRMREDDIRCQGLRADAIVTELGQIPGLLES